MDYVTKVAEMVSMLPPSEQSFAYEMVKRLVLAWDPDFTKLTPSEAAELAEDIAELTAKSEKDDAPMTLDEYMKSVGM